MSLVTIQDFENGVRVQLSPIDPEINVYLWLPEWREWRFCGNYDPNDGVFFVKRFARHRHQVLNSFGVSSYVIDTLERVGLKKIVLFVEDTREIFETTLENLKVNAVWKYWKELGFDRQAFLAIPLWEKKK